MQQTEIDSLRSRVENLEDDLVDQTERGDKATTAVHRFKAEADALRAAGRQALLAVTVSGLTIEGYRNACTQAGDLLRAALAGKAT